MRRRGDVNLEGKAGDREVFSSFSGFLRINCFRSYDSGKREVVG